jgi:hypothetical protein
VLAATRTALVQAVGERRWAAAAAAAAWWWLGGGGGGCVYDFLRDRLHLLDQPSPLMQVANTTLNPYIIPTSDMLVVSEGEGCGLANAEAVAARYLAKSV